VNSENMTANEVLALIPARGGSKSIPGKNIKTLGGYPLIAYSIAAAQAAETITRVIVSTDDPEIAAVAQRYAAEVPFLRPEGLAQDDTPDLPVFQHALTWLEKQEAYRPAVVVQLRPTSPFRRTWHIDQAVERLRARPNADAIRTVCEPFQNPFKMWRIETSGLMAPLVEIGLPEAYNLPRQALPPVYWQTGYVDAAWRKTILEKNSMTGDRILPLIIDPTEWVDIDSPADWRWAERLLASGELTPETLGFTIPPES
jgi:N-acylneuraminate cytidylyltransferase